MFLLSCCLFFIVVVVVVVVFGRYFGLVLAELSLIIYPFRSKFKRKSFLYKSIKKKVNERKKKDGDKTLNFFLATSFMNTVSLSCQFLFFFSFFLKNLSKSFLFHLKGIISVKGTISLKFQSNYI